MGGDIFRSSGTSGTEMSGIIAGKIVDGLCIVSRYWKRSDDVVPRLLIENAKILRSKAREIESMESCVREICVGID